jgi:hypothetical protein
MGLEGPEETAKEKMAKALAGDPRGDTMKIGPPEYSKLMREARALFPQYVWKQCNWCGCTYEELWGDRCPYCPNMVTIEPAVWRGPDGYLYTRKVTYRDSDNGVDSYP